MRSATQADIAEQAASTLIGLLHQGAPADEFARRLAEVDALPRTCAAKSALVETVRMAMAVRNRLELQQQRERGMLAVIESAQDLSSRLDLTEPAERHRLARAQPAGLATSRGCRPTTPSRGEFQRAGRRRRAVAEHRRHGRARATAASASIVMSTRLPFTTPDYLHDKRFAHDPKLDDTFRDEGIAALVGVPLIWDGEVIGLLFVADRYHRMHTAQSIVDPVHAGHARRGGAEERARLRARQRRARARPTQARAELERHVRSIQAAADAHEQMTSLLARGASLSTLCQTVAQLLGGSVLVLDEAAPA